MAEAWHLSEKLHQPVIILLEDDGTISVKVNATLPPSQARRLAQHLLTAAGAPVIDVVDALIGLHIRDD